MSLYRYVWYVENGGPKEAAKVKAWANNQWIDKLQLGDATHRTKVPFGTVTPGGTYAFIEQPLPDGEALERQIEAALGRGDGDSGAGEGG